ncbi:MAG: hypothetical protein ACXAD7_10405 [Candidatus Kariarchaeaceae archaeon]
MPILERTTENSSDTNDSTTRKYVNSVDFPLTFSASKYTDTKIWQKRISPKLENIKILCLLAHILLIY